MVLITPIFSLAMLSSCGEKDNDKIGDAQRCLDTVAYTQADTCVTKLDGIESAKAYEMRCAAKFIREGFGDASKMLTAFTSLDGSSGSSGLTSFMGLISFTSKQNITEDNATASTTFDYCLKSGAKGSTLIAAFGYMGLAIYDFFYINFPSTSCSAAPSGTGGNYDVAACLTSISGSPGNLLAFGTMLTNHSADNLLGSIGTIVISAYQLNCTGSTTNKSLCASLETPITNAGGTSDQISVGLYFLKSLIPGLP